MQPLASIVIGDLGESKFSDLCRIAGLEVAQPLPDRTGKDRIVEWPAIAPTDGITFDTRPAPLTCIVQVKSVMWPQQRVSLSLSSAERLARDLRPAFIVIPRLRKDGTVADIHVVHLRGALIGQLLKRLRQLSKNGKRLTKATISYTIGVGSPVSLNGPTMRQHLEAAIGTDMAAYAKAKQHELDHLGFDEKRVLMKVKLAGHTPEDFVDGLLGELKLNVTSIDFSERRFDIELPGVSFLPSVPKCTPALLTLRQASVTCRIDITTALDPEPLSINAELRSAGLPNGAIDLVKIQLRTPRLELVLRNHKLTLALREETSEQPWPLSVWAETARCIRMLYGPMAKITLTPSDDRPTFSFAGGMNADDETLKTLRAREWYFMALREVGRAAGCPDPVGTFAEFTRLDGQFVRFAQAAVRDSAELTSLSFETFGLDELEATSGSDVILLSQLRLGDQTIALAQKTVFEIEPMDRGRRWRSRRLKLLSVEKLVGEVGEAYEAFRLRIERISGITVQVDPWLFEPPQLDNAA